MEQTLIVGVDISKLTLDLHIKPYDLKLKIQNDTVGFKQWVLEFKKLCDCEARVLVVMEHTGYYSLKFERFLRSLSVGYCKVPALQIKRSLGVIRGKSDKVDAERIAEYGWLRREILMADPLIDEQIRELRSLLSLRQKLVRDRSSYLIRIKEVISTGASIASKDDVKMQQQIVAMFSKKIQQIENKINELIRSNGSLTKTAELLCSIKGVGKIIAAYMIACTDNFKRFSNARKFNCYAGLAPFKTESGTSIYGRARVSHLANKEAKTLLNLAACCAIRSDQEMKNYYQKRLSEGKRKMSCLNIVRSKIVARMFAVIKRQSPYQESLIAA